MLCDSNILIYAADPNDTQCSRFVEHPQAAIASVSRIEVLGFVGFVKLSADQRRRLSEIVASMVEFALDESVINRSIALRQQMKMSLGDAIIAATALEHRLPLVTRNTEDFKKISELQLLNPFDS